MSFHRPSLGDMIRAGGRSVSRYTGTVLALFVAQGLVASVAIVTIAQVLAAELARRPLLDHAVDGDLVSLVRVLRAAPHVITAAAWTVTGVVLLWMVTSWFLTGGVLAVLSERPDGRAATARCFGAGGANTFLSFVVLQVLSLVLYLPALFILGFGMSWGIDRAEDALTIGELMSATLLGLAPGAIALLVVGTIVDYARAELAIRKSTHEIGAFGALVRAIGFVATHPVTLIHAALGWLVIIAIGLAYVWVSHGRAMLGGGGALTIFVIREGLALVRMAIKFGVLGGQIELAQTRPPPRRAATAESTGRRR